jgi:hypothetical protein
MKSRAIAARELNATAQLALQYNQLLSHRGILKSAPGLEGRGNQVQEKKYQADHRGRG